MEQINLGTTLRGTNGSDPITLPHPLRHLPPK